MLFTSSAKSLQIAKQIDHARCEGQWKILPDLARRYVKHNPEGAALEQTVLAEVALVRMSQTDKPWNLKQAHSIQEQLQSVFELNEDVSSELKECAKVILARLFFGCKEYDQVLALLGGISLLNAQSTGYSFILYYQSLAIKAMSLEATGDMETCLQLYEYASRLLDDQHPIKDLTLVEWAEKALYQAIQLVSTYTFSFTVNDGATLDLLRSYHRATCHQPGTWRTERRMGTTLLMIKHLSKLYRSGVYIPQSSNSTHELADDNDDQKVFAEEIIQLYTICELMLRATKLSPISTKSNTMVLDMIESLSVDLDWIVEEKSEWQGYKEVLQCASEKTFNSPSLLRLLFLTNLRLGEYEEAQHALQSYLKLVGLVSHDDIEGRQDGGALVQDNSGRYLPLPAKFDHTAQSSHHLSSPAIDHQQNMNTESTEHQLDILIKAMEMFCSEVEMGIKAVEMADLALSLMQKCASVNLDSQQIARVYRLSGVSYGLLASQIIVYSLRPSYHEKALYLLNQANKMQSDSWKTLYSLALQHASMRNVDQAIQLIRHSLNINMEHLPSWHLLALALSCPGQKDQPQAQTVASAGLNIGLEQPGSLSTIEQLEQHLLLKMTYSRLLCDSEGPGRALEEHTSLLKLYGKWTTKDTSNNGSSVVFSGSNRSPSIGNGPWYGRISHGGENKAPRKIAISGPYGNVTPTVSSSSINHYPTSTTSSSLATTTMKSNKSRRRRSASSGMISHLQSSTHNGLTNCDSASMLSACTTTSGDEIKTRNTLAHKSRLRKYASNSMLKVPSSTHPSVQQWHNLHPSSSRSTNIQPLPSQSIHRMNGSGSNDTISKQFSTERASSRYNSMYSFQSGTSSGGHTPIGSASLNGSFNSATFTPATFLRTSQGQESGLTTSDYLQQQNQQARLCELWLMSAEWYFELSEWDEALKAISEAESICPTHPDVWYLLGKINHNKDKCCTSNDGCNTTSASAIQFFEKGLLLHPGHIENQIELAKLSMEQDMPMAEGILITVTRGSGWHSPEAWLLLGQIYQKTDRLDQAKKCLFYALELESVHPIRPFDILPRVASLTR